MAHILFIGYGNPLRCDDGFGWQLAHDLEGQFVKGTVEIVACHQLTPELAESISHADYVIFADATTERLPGELALCQIHAGNTSAAMFSHQLSPQGLLAVAHSLYGKCPGSAFLLKAHACDLGYGEHLSPQLSGTLNKAIRRIVSLCEFLSPQAVVTRQNGF